MSCPGLCNVMRCGALKFDRAGSGARPISTALSTYALVPSSACSTHSTGLRTNLGSCSGISTPHIRQVGAAGGLLCPFGQSVARTKESVDQSVDCISDGEGVVAANVGGMSTSA